MIPRRSGPAPPLALAALLVFAADAGSQQRNPGAPGGDGLSSSTFRAEYFAAVVPQVNDLMGRWSEAWSGDDAGALASLYTDDAVLLPLDGAAVVGRPALEEYFSGALGDFGTMEAFMQAFDGSGGMAFVYGTFLAGASGGRSGTASGELVTIFSRDGRDWRIRAQTFRAPPP